MMQGADLILKQARGLSLSERVEVARQLMDTIVGHIPPSAESVKITKARDAISKIQSAARKKNAPKASSFAPFVFPILFATALNICAVLFAQNRVIMAFWFVLTKLVVPIALILLVWTVATTQFRRQGMSIGRVIGRYSAILLLIFLALPIPLFCINLLPFGQTTDHWRGEVIHTELITHGNLQGGRVQVRSMSIGPLLSFDLSESQFYPGTGTHPNLVKGEVVRGFLGMPISAKISSQASISYTSR